MGADFRWTIDSDVRDQFAVFTHFYVCADGAVGADFAGWMNFRTGIKDGGGVDVHLGYMAYVLGL